MVYHDDVLSIIEHLIHLIENLIFWLYMWQVHWVQLRDLHDIWYFHLKSHQLEKKIFTLLICFQLRYYTINSVQTKLIGFLYTWQVCFLKLIGLTIMSRFVSWDIKICCQNLRLNFFCYTKHIVLIYLFPKPTNRFQTCWPLCRTSLIKWGRHTVW